MPSCIHFSVCVWSGGHGWAPFLLSWVRLCKRTNTAPHDLYCACNSCRPCRSRWEGSSAGNPAGPVFRGTAVLSGSVDDLQISRKTVRENLEPPHPGRSPSWDPGEKVPSPQEDSGTVATRNRTGASESCMKMTWWLVFAGKAAGFIKYFKILLLESQTPTELVSSHRAQLTLLSEVWQAHPARGLF